MKVNSHHVNGEECVICTVTSIETSYCFISQSEIPHKTGIQWFVVR